MNIRLNGEERALDGETTLGALVQALELGDRRIAVEVNAAIVPRGEHASYVLREGDRVEIVGAIGGG